MFTTQIVTPVLDFRRSRRSRFSLGNSLAFLLLTVFLPLCFGRGDLGNLHLTERSTQEC